MSLNGVGTTSLNSPTTQATGERATQNSNRGKQPSRPRKRFNGTCVIQLAFLTTDRLKPQEPNSPQPEKTPKMPRKPPGLSTPPEPVSEMEAPSPENDDPPGELCFICGNSMKERYFSLSPCNNAFCHNCSL